MRIEALLSRLDKVRPGKAGYWSAACCAHPDKRPSLRIHLDEKGGIHLNCYAGCTEGEILGALGLELRDLAPDQGRDRLIHSQGGVPVGHYLELIDHEAMVIGLLTGQIVDRAKHSRALKRALPEGDWERIAQAVRTLDGLRASLRPAR